MVSDEALQLAREIEHAPGARGPRGPRDALRQDPDRSLITAQDRLPDLGQLLPAQVDEDPGELVLFRPGRRLLLSGALPRRTARGRCAWIAANSVLLRMGFA